MSLVHICQQYGQLLALSRFDAKSWACVCACGRVCTATDKELLSSVKTDCGCVWRPPVPGYVGRNRFQYRDTVYTSQQIEHTFKIKQATFLLRIKNGWDVVRAIETPVRFRNHISRSTTC